jgi:nuclear receptor subfamily 1 group F protein 4
MKSETEWKLKQMKFHFSYNTYSNEVGYGSPYGGYSTSVTPQQTMGYDISADYVDSTTTYEPRSTIIDSDFIGGHSECTFYISIYLSISRTCYHTTNK